MVVILFRSKLTASAGLDYSGMNDELEGYVRNQPGFLDVKGFTALDGERLTVVWWEDKEPSLAAESAPRGSEERGPKEIVRVLQDGGGRSFSSEQV